MNRPLEMIGISSCLVKERESHRIMSVGDRESDTMMRQATCRRQERLEEDHGSNGDSSYNPVPVIERFGATAHRTGKEALLVPRDFTVGIQPLDEAGQGFGYSGRELVGCV